LSIHNIEKLNGTYKIDYEARGLDISFLDDVTDKNVEYASVQQARKTTSLCLRYKKGKVYNMTSRTKT